MPKARIAIVALTAVLVVGGAAVWFILGRGFSAREEPTSVEAWVARRLRRMATPRSARDARNPVPTTPETLAEARGHFADHCALCHDNDGSGQTEIGQALYPKPPDMRQAETQSLSDGELFYIIHNGIRLTGMPAWGTGATVEDEDSWKLVHFIRHLPNITPEELETMKNMNPKSPMELEEEEQIRRFLQGDDSQPTEPKHEQH